MTFKARSDKASLPASLAYTLRVTPVGTRLVLLVLLYLLTLVLLGVLKAPLTLFEERLGALRWQLFPETTPEERLVIVSIDEQSLEEIGAWPWSRATLAQLSERLQQAGVSAQIYDLVLPESRKDDALLHHTLQQNQAILGQIPLLDQSQQTGVPSTPLPFAQNANFIEQGCRPSGERSSAGDHSITHATGFLANTSIYSDLTAGHITPTVDRDGMIRFQSPLICYENQLYPSLALSTLISNWGIPQLHWLTASNHPETARPFSVMPPPLAVGAENYPLLYLPLNEQGQMRVSYHKSPQSYRYISAADLLKGRISPQVLQNRWVLVGATAFGLGDVVPTPFSGLAPGVEIQARILTSMLDQNIPYTPAGIAFYQVVLSALEILLLLFLASAVSHHRHKLARGVLLSSPVTLPLLMLGLHQVALGYSLWLGWLPQALFGAIAALGIIALEYLRNRLERQRLYDNLSSYLPEAFASEIAFHQPSDQVQVRDRHFIVLNADLRNFSAYQQHRPAEETARLLHSFFSLATRITEAHQGIVYELRADAMLAVWPLDQPDPLSAQSTNRGGSPADRRQAAKAQQAAEALHHQLQPLLDHPLPDPLEPLGLGIGIAAGKVTEGTLGTSGRRTQMLMGETVTLAIRLQSMTGELAYPILCEAGFTQLLEPRSTQNLGRYLLEGLTSPRTVYAPSTPMTDSVVTPLRPRVKQGA